MNTLQKTPVIELIAHVYKHSNEAKGHSWLLLNAALKSCLDVAITSQFKFEREDFSQLGKYGFSYWGGVNSDKMFAEHYYSSAVKCKNRSAAISFETWKERKPFMLNSQRLSLRSEFLYSETPVTRNSKNLLRVWITHIDKEKIVFCWYDNPGQWQKGAPARRFSFTHAELKAAQKEGRAALTVEHLQDWIKKNELEGK